jgi:hypothetical protein
LRVQSNRSKVKVNGFEIWLSGCQSDPSGKLLEAFDDSLRSCSRYRLGSRAPADKKADPNAIRIGLELFSSCGLLSWNFPTQATNQSYGILTYPLVAEAGRLAVSSNFLSVPAAQVQDALRDKDSAEAEQERKEANIHPGKTHESLLLLP